MPSSVDYNRIGREAAERFFERFKPVYLQVLRDSLVDDFVFFFSELYDRYLIDPFPNTNPYDLSSPRNIKKDVVNYVRESLTEGIEKASFEGYRLHLSAINDAVFSRPTRRSTDKLKLFHFYIYGVPGRYVVLGKREYSKMGSYLKDERLGRFGTVHMLPYHKYESRYRKSGGSKKGWPAPSSIEHPFSGMGPVRIFEDTLSLVLKRDEEYVKKAIDLVIGT